MRSRHDETSSLWLKEPLLHFFVLALIVFAGYEALKREDEFLLEIPQNEIEARISLVELSQGKAASQGQRDEIEALYLEEQMLVREALALNLDRDARIHDMLAQKMRHVLSGEVIQPDDEEMRAFYLQNIDAYKTPPTIIADEIIFETTERLPHEVNQLLMSGASPDSLMALEKASMNTLPRINAAQLGNLFSSEFSDQVFNAEKGEWVGPQQSELGQHWLRVIDSEDSKTPSLDEIRNRVRLEWIDQEEETRLQREVDQLWEKYSVKILGDRAEH